MSVESFKQLVLEHADLSVKIYARKVYIASAAYAALSTEEQDLLDSQVVAELSLLSVMRQRIVFEFSSV